MSAVDMDPASRLPMLPAGQWWEVRKYTRNSGYVIGEYVDGYEVCLMGKKFIPGTVTYSTHWWWTKPTYTQGRYEDGVLLSRQITDPELYAYQGNRAIYRVGKSVIEPADVLKAALDIMDDMEAKQEAKARKESSEALVGAYPPKTLWAGTRNEATG